MSRRIVALSVILGIALTGCGYFGQSNPSMVFHTVKRGGLTITVIERGTLESQSVTEIKCEVESLGFEATGNVGTQIISIVPNGSSVQAGDLLVELDTSVLRDRIDQQVLVFEDTKARQIQAESKFENQKTQNETALNEATVNVKLAEMELRMYDDGEDGSYQIARQEGLLKIQEAKSQISEAQTALAMRARDLSGVKRLFQGGYRGRGDLEQAQYSHMQAEDALLRAVNAMASANSSHRKLEYYEYPMQRLKLESAVNTARRAKIQVERDNHSLLAQAKAAKVAADRALHKEQEKLERYRAQAEKCKIMAPHDGVVAYARTPGTVVTEGEFVNHRQTLLTLPDLSKMLVKTSIPGSMSSVVKHGMPATITVEGYTRQSYRGTVASVAVMPSSKNILASHIKTYETIVEIDDPVDGLKPGVTAEVQILVDDLQDVLSVPVQAIVQVGNDNWCYVLKNGSLRKRSVQIGQTNDKFVSIDEGLSENDQVVLNPMDIVDQERDQASLLQASVSHAMN